MIRLVEPSKGKESTNIVQTINLDESTVKKIHFLLSRPTAKAARAKGRARARARARAAVERCPKPCLHESSNPGSTHFRSRTEFQSTNGCGLSQPTLQSGLGAFTLEVNPG